MARYYVTSLGGMERFVRQEVSRRLPGAVLAPTATTDDWGRTHFDYDGPPADTLTLRTVHNVFAAVAEFSGIGSGEEALADIRRLVSESDFGPALAMFESIHGRREDPSFRCTSKRVGEQAYTSMNIMAAGGAGVVDTFGWRVDLTGYDYDVHVDLEDDRMTVGLRLSVVGLHHRSRVVHVPASLNPTLAHAVCAASDPQANERFVDITCGAGTILIERATFGPARLFAGDIFRHPTEMASRNFAEAGLDVGLCQWDARNLPLASDSVDKIVGNLPWGRRAGTHTVNIHIYPKLVKEIARVLRIGGRAVLLTLEKKMMARCLGKHGWLRVVEVIPVAIGGLKPSMYVVERWRGQDRPEGM